MGADLFDLAARISVDTSKSDKALTDTQKKVLELAQEFDKTDKTASKAINHIGQSMASAQAHISKLKVSNLTADFDRFTNALRNNSVNVKKSADAFLDLFEKVNGGKGTLGGLKTSVGDMSEALSVVSPRAGLFAASLTGAAGPLAALTVGLIANIAAVYKLHTGLLDLATSTAKWQGALTDLSQQTGVSVEMLSSLDILAQQTGGSIEGIATSLGVFQGNLEDSLVNPAGRAAQALDELGVSTLETEQALDQALTALAGMQEGFHQTALARDLFGGRGAKLLLAILKETGGDLDAAREKLRAMGLELGGPASAAADKLNDKIVILDRQVLMLKASLGTMIMPHVEKNVDSLTNAINTNKGAINQAAIAVGFLAGYLGSNLVAAIHIANAALASMAAYLGPLTMLMQTISGLSGQTGNIPAVGLPGNVDAGGGASVGGGFLRKKGIGGGGGRGGGGGGGGGMDEGVTLLQQLQKEFYRLTQHTKLEEIQEQLLEKQFAKTSDQIKKRIVVTAMEIDIQKKNLELTRERFATEESYARFAEEEFIKSLTRVRAMGQIQRERFATAAGQNRPDWIDLGGGSTAGGEPGTTGRERFATIDRQALQDQIDAFNMRIAQLAASVTNVIDRAISTGFERGIKAGLISFAQGILDMIRSAALDALQQKLMDVFSKALGGGSGGGIMGWISKLLGIAGSAVGGKGGLSGMPPLLGFASGGVMKPNTWGLVGERGPELIRAGSQGATVSPNGAGGAVHLTVNYHASPGEQPASKPTVYQMAKQLHAGLSKVALTG